MHNKYAKGLASFLLHPMFKKRLLLAFIVPFIYCQQQSRDAYKENYGLYNNVYDFPNDCKPKLWRASLDDKLTGLL